MPCARGSKKRAPAVGAGARGKHREAAGTMGYSVHRVSHPMTSSCHWMEFCGFRTQWFSSGK